MKTDYMMNVDDVSEKLGESKGHAYKIIRELNDELAKKGFIVIAGKIPKAYWNTKFYGESTERIAI